MSEPVRLERPAVDSPRVQALIDWLAKMQARKWQNERREPREEEAS